ncbi:MAG: murein hydrolase activator EnvC family protein [Alphaproteobacteria bacterium]|jgi:septal ring factor EnvC (AmiA/AmiB activator)
MVLAGGLVALVFSLLASPAVQAQQANPTQERLDDVRDSLLRDAKTVKALARDAEDQARELSKIRSEMRAAAHAVQSHENALDALESELALLEGDATRKQVQFERRRRTLGHTLAALQRLSLRPTAALLVSPGDPNDVVRSGLLLRTAVPEIESQARRLRTDIDELNAVQLRIQSRRAALQVAALDLKRDRDRLSELSKAKDKVLNQTQSARAAAEKRVKQLQSEARTLEELLSNLRDSTVAARPQSRPNQGETGETLVAPTLKPAGPSIASAQGQLSLPAQGTVLRRFGAETEAGARAHGVTWKTRANASVVAPWDGRIVFAGPFRRFGQILIIDHGEGYHSLIAGLGRIDAQMDQWVLAGEPVGAMGAGTKDAPGPNAGAKSGGRASQAQNRSRGPTLYVEFRRDGQPINPLPWLAAQTDRTQG